MAFDLGAGSLAQNPGKSDLAQKYMQSRGFQSEGLYSKSFLQLCQLTWWIVLRFPVTVMQSVVINHRKVMQLIANNCFNHLPHSFLGFVFFFLPTKTDGLDLLCLSSVLWKQRRQTETLL